MSQNTEIFYSNSCVKAINFFNERQLNFPFILKEIKSKIDEIQPGVFSSRESPTTIYDLNYFLGEVLCDKVDDYALFGVGGHGLKSHALHYYAVNAHLALFFQLAYGNAYEDENGSSRVNGMLDAVEIFFAAITAATEKGLIPDGHRLMVIDSDFYGKGWCWIKEGQKIIDEASWHPDTTLMQALKAIPS